MRDLAVAPAVLALLRRAYGREPVPFQTLTFRVGTEQPLHADAAHFSSLPPRLVAAAWVALEDVGPGSGPLVHVPGSHLWPEVDDALEQSRGSATGLVDHDAYEQAVATAVADRVGAERSQMIATAGDVLVWTSHLLHGGARVTTPGATRRSHVTHYTFEGCTLVTPLRSRPDAGEHHVRVVHDIARGRTVRPSVDGVPVALIASAGGRSRIVVDPGRRDRAAAVTSGLVRGMPRTRARLAAAAAREAARWHLR